MSPVRDLTDRPRRIPRLGKIRLGDRSGRHGAPVNKPFFVVPEEVQAVYGPEPTELRIVFLSDDEEVIASSYYRAYNASNGLVCRGTGFNAQAQLDADVLAKRGGDITQPLPIDAWAHGATPGRDGATQKVVSNFIDCPGAGYDNHAACPMFAAKKCAVRTFFQFAIYGVPGLGVYQMDTGSVVNVQRILGVLEMCKTLAGGVAGVPMILSRVKTDVAPDGVKKSVWTVDLRVDTQYSLTEVLKLRTGPLAQSLLPPVDESEVYEDLDDDLPELPEPGVTTTGTSTPEIDWPAFLLTLSGFGIKAEDVVRVVPIANGKPTAGDFKRWLEANPGKTTDELTAAILKARIDACEHDAGQYDEKLTVMCCSKCGLELDGPDMEEAKQEQLV
jgi:hypothetical protein